MKDHQSHFIHHKASAREALERLNRVGTNLTLFVIDDNNALKGSLTDGDIRRGFLKGLTIDDDAFKFANTNFSFLRQYKYSVDDFKKLKAKSIQLVPLLDEKDIVLRLIDLNETRSLLPIHAVIMAGGEGRRLRPLTDKTPKPLLKVGDKPIIEHNVDRLRKYGVEHFTVSINYLGEQLQNFFGDGSAKGIAVNYIREASPLGTLGSITLQEEFHYDNILVMNSDLLTNIDFEDMFREFTVKNADFAVATIPYQVSVPYAVLETWDENVTSLKEKPIYTFYANAGIYIFKKELVQLIPKNSFYNATDFIEKLIENKNKVIYYPIYGYWLDIGQHEDYHKAMEDIKHINL